MKDVDLAFLEIPDADIEKMRKLLKSVEVADRYKVMVRAFQLGYEIRKKEEREVRLCQKNLNKKKN